MPIFVNNVEITDDEVHKEMQYHPAPSVDEARQGAAQSLVIRQLLLQKAKEKGLLSKSAQASEDIEQAVEKLLEQEVSVPEAAEPFCRRYYEQNPERFADKKTGETLPFEMVSDHIRSYLITRSMRTGISQYIQVLAENAKIIGFELEHGEVT